MASSNKLSSSSYSPFETNSTNLRDDSFSSYLALIRQSFSAELAGGASSSRRSSFQATTILPHPKRASKDSGEIDVFDAEKYFNGSLDGFLQGCPDLVSETSASRSKKTNKSAAMSRSSTCSETSTNSHSMLLQDRPQQQQQQQQPPAPRRRSFLDVFRCSCSKKTAVKVEDDSDVDSSKLPGGVLMKGVHSESSSDLFEIGSVSMSSHAVWEPSEASVEWSVTTASAANLSSAASESERASEGRKARRSSSGFLGFGCASEKAVRSGAAAAADQTGRVGSLERYHVMMDLESVGVARYEAAARPRRASIGY